MSVPKEIKKVTTNTLQKMKAAGEKIAMITAYDFSFASIFDAAGIDIILVGDSASNVMAGHTTTLPITLDQMIYHAQSVVRARERSLIVCDIPFGYYQSNSDIALASAISIMKESGANTVKLEGGEEVIDSVKKIVSAGIPVMGHLGLTPQSVHRTGYRVQGGTPEAAEEILHQSKALVEAGIFALVLENIPAELAAKITNLLPIPTIGIGAGKACDGQILVTHDVLGLSDWQPPFAKKYADLQGVITDAVKQYCQDVRAN